MAQEFNDLINTVVGKIPANDSGGVIILPSAEKTAGVKGGNLYSIIIDELLKQPSITQGQLKLIQSLLPYKL